MLPQTTPPECTFLGNQPIRNLSSKHLLYWPLALWPSVPCPNQSPPKYQTAGDSSSPPEITKITPSDQSWTFLFCPLLPVKNTTKAHGFPSLLRVPDQPLGFPSIPVGCAMLLIPKDMSDTLFFLKKDFYYDSHIHSYYCVWPKQIPADFKPVSASIFLAERPLYNSLEGMTIIGQCGLYL